MEAVRHLFYGNHGNILRKIAVNLLHQSLRSQLRIHMEAGDLPVSMDARIRAAGAMDFHRFPGNAGQQAFKLSLDGVFLRICFQETAVGRLRILPAARIRSALLLPALIS